MECPRCYGLMVIDTCLNREGVRNTVLIYEWRCLNCGEIFDAQTLANRNASQQKAISRHAQKVA
jgi:uncharacterized Zn finger protein